MRHLFINFEKRYATYIMCIGLISTLDYLRQEHESRTGGSLAFAVFHESFIKFASHKTALTNSHLLPDVSCQ